MYLMIELIIINVVYALIWFIVYKLHSSKNENIRLLFNDYEFYETLTKTERELYWQEDTKLINTFLLQLLFVLNITILLIWFTKNNYLYLFLCFAFLILITLYTKAYFKLKRKFKR